MPDGLGTNPGALYWPLPGNRQLDWGLSQLNLNNSFTASILYDLPFGKGKYWGSNWSGPVDALLGHWQADLIVRATSGFPLYVVDSGDGSGTFFSYNGNTFQRPNQVGDPNRGGPEGGRTDCPAQVHTISNWFNPCAFASSPPGRTRYRGARPALRAALCEHRFLVNQGLPASVPRRYEPAVPRRVLQSPEPSAVLHGRCRRNGEQDINSQHSFGVINNTVNNPRLVQFALKLNF